MKDLPEHLEDEFYRPEKPPRVRTGRRKRPEWAQSDAALAERIIGPERIAKLRRALAKLPARDAQRAKVRALLSPEMLHRFNVASMYYGANLRAEDIAESTGKTISAVQSLIYRLTRAIKTVSSPSMRGTLSELAMHLSIAEELELAVAQYERKAELCVQGYKLAISGLNSGKPKIVEMARQLVPKVEELNAELLKDRERLDRLQAVLDRAESDELVTLEGR